MKLVTYAPLSLQDVYTDYAKEKTDMEVRLHEWEWLSEKLRNLSFPHAEGHSAPALHVGFGFGCRRVYIWAYGLTTEMSCCLAGEIEAATGCEMHRYDNTSDYMAKVEYNFKGMRAGREIQFQFVAADVEGCQVVEEAVPYKYKRVVCS